MTDTTASTPQVDTGKGEVLSQTPIMKEDADPTGDFFEEESSGGVVEDNDEADPNADLEPDTDLDDDEVEGKGNDAGAKEGDIADEDVDNSKLELPGYQHRAPLEPQTSNRAQLERIKKQQEEAKKREEQAKKAQQEAEEKKKKELAKKKEKEEKKAAGGSDDASSTNSSLISKKAPHT